MSVIRELQRQGVSEIPERHTISRIYQKFLQTGSVEDIKPPGRPMTIDETKIKEVKEDMDLRVEMCERLIPILEDEQNNGNIFFSDESTFYLSGFVNKHNCRIWAPTNPYVTIEAAMHSAKINVWCATVNQQNYLALLKDYVYPILKRKRIEKRVLFQQDGASPHFSKDCSCLVK